MSDFRSSANWRYGVSCRDLGHMIAECGMSVDPATMPGAHSFRRIGQHTRITDGRACTTHGCRKPRAEWSALLQGAQALLGRRQLQWHFVQWTLLYPRSVAITSVDQQSPGLIADRARGSS